MPRFLFFKPFFALIVFLIIIAGCSMSGQTNSTGPSENTVDIFIAPTGVQPLIFLNEGGDRICRRGIPDETIYGLDPEEKVDSEADEGEGEEETQEEDDSSRSAPIPTIKVDKNWFKMGLVIVNKSTSYWLVVTDLQFKIEATWGDETLKATDNIGSGYCGSSPLYIVRPTPKNAKNSYSGDQYEPLKKDYVNNLTLFISGVPIPEGPPTYKERENDAKSAVQSTRQEGQNITRTEEEEFVLTSLPPYRVQMVVHGYWVDKSRNTVANFQKLVRFSLSSQFLN